MSFPIPVNMTVSENSVNYDMGIETKIVAGTEYEGPYSVTPTEQAQTLETKDKGMTDDVSIGAIPSDYVGSAIPRRTSRHVHLLIINDVPTIVVQRGYYDSAKEKDITTGTATTPATSITANPTVSVDSNGLVTASVSASKSVTPTVNEGYVMSGTAGTVSVQGSSTLQLSTQAAQTITPTTADQTIASGKFLTGAQTIKGDANLLPENIKRGVTIFGIVGTYDGN